MNKRLRKKHRAQMRAQRRTTPGAAPGKIVVDPAAPPPVVRMIRFNADRIEERTLPDLDALPKTIGKNGDDAIVWIDVVGLGDADAVRRLGEAFGLHPLALEDVVNTHQRAKVDDFGDHLFFVARMFMPGEHVESEQFSLFLGKNFVLTFQERPGDCLEPVRRRLRKQDSWIRARGSDYLAYALIDAVIDAYFPVLEGFGERLDQIDDELSTKPGRLTIEEIHTLRSELLLMRRAAWPLRDALEELARDVHPLICDETRMFFRDGRDHTFQILDLIETSREICSDLRDFQLSAINNRMGEVMKVLTIITTLFVPLTFIAGVYGMNFRPEASAWNMPELTWPFGYPMILGLMGLVTVGQLLLFWRRGWLGR